MKLQLVETMVVQNRGGERRRKIFETPNGTRVVHLKHGYYPVSKAGHINSKRRFAGKVGDCEIWETTGKRNSVTLTRIII